MLRRLLILAALALPMRAEPLVKWVEPRHYDARTGILHFEQYWLFESDWNSDLGAWVYEQHQVTLWACLEIEIPPRDEGGEEP